ncbi:MAG: phosphoribosylformylglycinamidine synthase subunit PurQ, partial [Planctomycetes bacterium]|nr:phosphoribosylformylglycinamidine synthase subunit PurQ [Planctomycetota bacterium]
KLRAAENTVCVFAEAGEEIEVPVAHGEGKLVTRGSGVLDELLANGQVVYRYIARDGSEPVYPEDPNGSIDHIAGICDKSGRVFGLMPHPERHLYAHNHPRWTREGREGEGEGLRVFTRAVEYCKKA